jgi:hypothetical protein
MQILIPGIMVGLIVLALVASVTGKRTNTSGTKDSGKVVTFSQDGLSFYYPSSWTTDKTSDNTQIFYTSTGQQILFIERMKSENGTKIVLKDLINTSEDKPKELQDRVKDSFKIGKFEAIRVMQISSSINSGPDEVVMIALPEKSEVIKITFLPEATDRLIDDEIKGVFDPLVKSIRIQ